MIGIDEYIARRKKEDGINELDVEKRMENLKICTGYLFEYFMNYVCMTESEQITKTYNKKREYYSNQLEGYSPEVRDWALRIYDDCGKKITTHIGNALYKYESFFLYTEESEFRSVSYDCFARLSKKLPFMSGQSEILHRCIKDYHRVQSEKNYSYGIPFITDEVDEWIENTWLSYNVNINKFAFAWIMDFSSRPETWPASYRKQNAKVPSIYDYDFKQKKNLFGIDLLYPSLPNKPFIKGHKQHLETMFMYFWLHYIDGDENGYWEQYLKIASPQSI